MEDLSPHSLLKALHFAVVITDRSGIVTTLTPFAVKIFTNCDQNSVGKPLAKIHTETAKIFLESLATGRSFPDFKSRAFDTDFRGHIGPVINDGEIIGAMGIFQTKSEIEKYARQMGIDQDIVKQQEAILNSSFDGLFITDGKGNILKLNEKSARLNNYDPQEILGKNILQMLELGYIDRSVTLEVMQKKAAVTLLQRVKNGKQIIVTGTPVFDEKGEIEFIVTNERDITMLNLMKQQLQDDQNLAKLHTHEILHHEIDELYTSDIVAVAEKSKAILQVASGVARYDTTTLITGESGVGKGLIAKFIHESSQRKNGPFIRIDCGAIPEPLLESELFGYRKGAFTGANVIGKQGRVQAADNGTLFFDEIGEVPLKMQVKLLRLLESGEFVSVGETRSKKINTRIIAASNRDLKEMVDKGLFRLDLYYRLNVVPLHIPPLRERAEDIPLLVHKVLRRLSKRLKIYKTIDPEVVNILSSYPFPGNVRELENLIERLIILCPHEEIQVHHLPQEMVSDILINDPLDLIEQGLTLKEIVAKFEYKLIQKALKRYGSKRQTALALGVNSSTIVRKTQKYAVGANGVIMHHERCKSAMNASAK